MSKNLEDEITKIKTDMESLADKGTKPLLQAYKSSLNRIRSEIAHIYMLYTIDNQLKMSKQQRYRVLKQLEKQLLQEAKKLGAIDVKETTNILNQVYTKCYYRTAYVFDSGLFTNIDFSLLRPEMVKAAVEMPIKSEMFSDRIWANKEKLVSRIRNDIEKAMIEGKSIEKLARQIKKDFGVSAMESHRLIQTEMARCQTQANLDIYESSGVVDKVMWTATLDYKTNPIDASYDGKMWDVNDKSKPTIPNHPSCRCCWIPVLDGWSPTKRRENVKDSSGKKPVNEYRNYEEWLKSKNIK